MAKDSYEYDPDYRDDGDDASGNESTVSSKKHAQIQDPPLTITSEHWREEPMKIHPSMIPVFTAYNDSSDIPEEILLTAFKPTVNHNVTQSQLCAEMMNNFLGEVYKTKASHKCSLSNDKMHAAWGVFVSVCVCVHLTELSSFVYIFACVLQDWNQCFCLYMSGRDPTNTSNRSYEVRALQTCKQ